ncbi:HAD-IIIC family phosphatase [Archangium lipolyticum]|uniref:HAD-IIIC family phosphatase n=1 Tax=Archangium lipolyticum TaxID=2970465 RepID=UPI00214A0B77|nr:HAD-IIIC family phosphatase [Archangium lipolyticum]
MERFRLSRFVQLLPYGQTVIITHGPRLRRVVVTEALAESLKLFASQALSPREYEAFFPTPKTAALLFQFFRARGLIVPDGLDELETLARELGLSKENAAAKKGKVLEDRHEAVMFGKAESLSPTDFDARDGQLAPLRVALVGGCVLQVMPDFIKKAGLQHGYLVEVVSVTWPDSAERIRAAAAENADVVVFHPFIRQNLEPLWDRYHLLSEAERDEHLASLIEQLRIKLGAFTEGRAGRLGLVHNLSLPQVSPRGRYDLSFFQAMGRINDVLMEHCRAHPNILPINEEAIASRFGKQGVLDDLHDVFSHHGHGLVGLNELPEWADAERTRDFIGTLAEEYIHAHEVWLGKGQLKLVVCDLDNTIWPGVAGEEGFSWYHDGFYLGGPFEGIHQALHLLKSRGILLATCSKNDEKSVLDLWRQQWRKGALGPDDFVVHRINWKRKSENIVDLANQLGVGLDAILFLDDNPVERQEVRQSLPEVLVWDGPIHEARAYLLREHRLERATLSAEALSRTEMMKGQLLREQSRASARSEDEFLRTLEVRLDIAPALPDEAARVTELIQRTNQFNTTLERLAPDEVSRLVERGRVWRLKVSDRFTDYGLVGVVVLDEGVRLMVLSCRVIGLRVPVPFLATVLRASGMAGSNPRARLVIGPRNEPARSVFLDTGFQAAPSEDNLFVLPNAEALAPVDASIYRLTLSGALVE